jgi:DNA-binding LacI/PurR family transcriptional regulator
MKTVSNVVHNYPHVSPEMKAKVQAAVEELGYRPNLTARTLATGRTGMIALAMPEIDHPYFSELSRFISEEAADRGYRVLIEQTANDAGAERAVLNDREAGLVDGIIFQPSRLDTLEITRLQRDNPLVLLGEAAIPVTADHVMIDNVVAARDAVSHLIALGRKRIVFLAVVDGDNLGATNRRLEGYQQALLEAGLTPDPALVLTSKDFSPEEASDSLQQAIEVGLEFDAVVCRDDRLAMGALRALHNSKIDIPNQVAVVGWDDTELSEYSFPTLTTVSPDKAELARVAVDLLMDRIEGYTGPGRHRVVAHTLSVRDSAPSP